MGIYWKPYIKIASKTSDLALDQLEKSIKILEHRRELLIKNMNKRAAVSRAKSLGIKSILNNEAEFRILLNERIIQEVRKNKLRHIDLADISMIPRTRITGIMNGHLKSVSTDALIKILNTLGLKLAVQLEYPSDV